MTWNGMCEKRPAVPGDPPCSCGRPARVVYITERWGDVPDCATSDLDRMPLPERFDNPAWVARWGHPPPGELALGVLDTD
jgi:hypothetical protein